MQSPAEPTIYDRVAAHSTAVARHEASCDAADPKSEIGSSLTPSELFVAAAEYNAASDLEIQTFNELLAHVPSNIVELRRQIGYVQFFLNCRDVLDRDRARSVVQLATAFQPAPDRRSCLLHHLGRNGMITTPSLRDKEIARRPEVRFQHPALLYAENQAEITDIGSLAVEVHALAVLRNKANHDWSVAFEAWVLAQGLGKTRTKDVEERRRRRDAFNETCPEIVEQQRELAYRAETAGMQLEFKIDAFTAGAMHLCPRLLRGEHDQPQVAA